MRTHWDFERWVEAKRFIRSINFKDARLSKQKGLQLGIALALLFYSMIVMWNLSDSAREFRWRQTLLVTQFKTFLSMSLAIFVCPTIVQAYQFRFRALKDQSAFRN